MPYIYGTDESKLYTNYWKPLLNEVGQTIGLIGLQVDITNYEKLIPEPVIEEPYSLSFINLYNSNLETIWQWGCTDCDQD